MKKSKIFTFSGRIFLQNFVIIFVIAFSAILSVFCINLTPVAKNSSEIYYFGDKNSNKISLMINVYWGTEYLDDMLEILKKYDVKTTFFVGGTWAVKESDKLQKIVDDGHEIANHGYGHKDHSKLSEDAQRKEILNTHKIVKELVGVDMNLFAPPSGAYNKTTLKVVSELGYKAVMWTQGKDTIDWRDHDSNLIFQRATRNCHGGDLILMHPTEATKNALERILTTIQDLNFQICSVSENLSQK